MKRLIFLLCLLLFPLQSFATDIIFDGEPYTLKPHPRIMVGGKLSLTDLRAKMLSTNPYWIEFRDYFVAERGSNPSYTDTIPDGSNSIFMESYAMLYMLDPIKYADMGAAAKELLMSYPEFYKDRQPSAATDWARFFMFSIAKTYDWIYPLLTNAEKVAINTAVNDQIYAEALTGYSLDSDYHNLHVTQFTAELMYGLATYEDNGPTDGNGTSGNNSEDMLTKGYADWINFRVKYADKLFIGGRTFSGSEYGFNRVTTFCFRNLEVLNSAVGLNQWDSVPWAKNVLNYFIHTTLPGTNNGMYPDGNVGGDTFDPRKLESVILPLNHLSDTTIGKHAKYWLESTVDIQNILINRAYKMLWFLWYDPSWPELDYNNFSTWVFSKGVGLYQGRSSWSSDATFWGFSAAPWYADHQGWDSGSFKIWRDGEWLVYENGPDGNGMSVDTNQMYLDDGYVLSAYSKLRYTGGFAYNNMMQDTSSEIDRSISTNKYNYARGNITKSYADNRALTSGSNPFYKLEYYSREIFHVKASDYLLVFDNVTSGTGMGSINGIVNGSEVIKTMRIHIPGKPTIAGNTYTYTGSNSKIIANVVLPSPATITSTLLNDKTSGISTDTPYRVDIVRPAAAVGHDNFLTIYRIGSSSITMPTATAISGTGIAGVYVADSTPFAVLFGNETDGSNLTEASILVKQDSTADIYFVGLTPSTSYSVIVSGGNTIDTILTTNRAGILELPLINTGDTNISIQKLENATSSDEVNDPAPLIMSIKSDL
jgi:hypothetical protein